MAILSPTINSFYYVDSSFTTTEPGTLYYYVAGGGGGAGGTYVNTDIYGNPTGYRNGGAGNSGQYVYGSTVVMSMDSTGNLTAASNITAYGAP